MGYHITRNGPGKPEHHQKDQETTVMALPPSDTSQPSPQFYQRQEPGIEEDIGLSHIHGGDKLANVGAVVSGDQGTRLQDITLQHTIQIHGQQLHTLRQDKLWGMVNSSP